MIGHLPLTANPSNQKAEDGVDIASGCKGFGVLGSGF